MANTTSKDTTMPANWMQRKGKVQDAWGKLTPDDVDHIKGNRKQLLTRLQERYGYNHDDAEKQVMDFEKRNSDWKWDA